MQIMEVNGMSGFQEDLAGLPHMDIKAKRKPGFQMIIEEFRKYIIHIYIIRLLIENLIRKINQDLWMIHH